MAVFENWWLSLRTAVIGTLIGIIPGLGGDVATWICYGHAAQTCKNNENFGKGDIRGVIGVETDFLFPIEQQEELAIGLKDYVPDVDFRRLDSRQGHDSFLVDMDRFRPAIASQF